jgi:DNA-binding MarR family transcriptional regulator
MDVEQVDEANEIDETAGGDIEEIAAALHMSLGMLVRRLRQLRVPGALSLPETSALARLDRGGPTTASALAKAEQISPQSMGTTLAALEARGLVERRADPDDRRRVVLSVSEAGRQVLRDKRSVRTQQLARALAGGFTPREQQRLKVAAPLIERLAQAI